MTPVGERLARIDELLSEVWTEIKALANHFQDAERLGHGQRPRLRTDEQPVGGFVVKAPEAVIGDAAAAKRLADPGPADPPPTHRAPLPPAEDEDPIPLGPGSQYRLAMDRLKEARAHRDKAARTCGPQQRQDHLEAALEIEDSLRAEGWIVIKYGTDLIAGSTLKRVHQQQEQAS